MQFSFGKTKALTEELDAPHLSLVSKEERAGILPIKKTDEDQQLVFGEVYAPTMPDSQGDFMSAERIRQMAYDFMQRASLSKIDTQHSRKENGSYIVESFIAREDDTLYIPGSWVIGVHIPAPETWELVKSGEINGFSLDGMGIRVPTEIEIEIPDMLNGMTLENDGHSHSFVVKFDGQGNFLGGQTTPAEDGHWHRIVKGTVTEDENGHNHRFSFMEGVLLAQAPHQGE